MPLWSVNGIELYHERSGAGPPLVLLHGGLGAVETMAPLAAAFAGAREVISVDLQGHGRTADVDRPLAFERMADDVAALMRALGLAEADVFGFSLGAGVALRIAIQHPAQVRRLVAVSFPMKRDGWFPDILAAMAQMGPAAAEAMKPSPFYRHYEAVAPRPGDWPRLVTKLGDLLRQDWDWSAAVAALGMPALLVFADADSIRPQHIAEFFALLGGGLRDAGWDGAARPASRLAVLPGTTHYDIFAAPLLATVAHGFLTMV